MNFVLCAAYQTPIISAAMNGVIEMVEKILQVFPMTIHDRDKYGRNIVLTAVEFGQSHVYDFLLRRRYVVDKDLAFYERDINGNTIMHRAAMLVDDQGRIQGANSMLHLQWEVKWYEVYAINSQSYVLLLGYDRFSENLRKNANERKQKGKV